MKIIEIAGPDTSLKFPIVADGGRERVIEWISTEMGKSEDVLLVAQKGSTLINTCIIEVEHEDGLSPENFYANFIENYPVMDCDILHLHHPKYLIFTKHIKAKKIVLTHHGYYKNPYSCDYKFSETYVSHFLKDFTNNTQGYVVYNPIPMIEYPLTQNKKREYLFFIGACDKKVKRLDIAIEVAEKSNHKLIVAGTASQSLKSYLSTLAFVEYIGEVNQTEKLKLFSKSKAVICPNDSPEAFCLVAAEANAVGIPVIASNNGGLPEVIGNNISGYICYSLNDYLNAITKVNTLNVNKVRNYTKSKFDISIISNDYLSLFNQLLNEK